MKSVVDFLWQQYNDNCDCAGDVEYTTMEEIIYQAKEMENKQFKLLKDFDTWKEWKDTEL